MCWGFFQDTNMYLYFISFLHTGKSQIVEIHADGSWESTYLTLPMPQLLIFWQYEEPGHQYPWYSGRGRHWNFDPLQCLGPRPDILNRYISLSPLRWLPTACHERLAYFHWPQWVTWLVTWWVTWSRWPEAGRHIGKFSLWTTLLRFSRSAQISLFSNFTKLGQLFFDNIFFGLTSQGFCADQNYPWKKCIKSKQSKRDREKLQPLFNIPLLNTPWQ